jgi:endonuclease YncB( thermonuclease family)
VNPRYFFPKKAKFVSKKPTLTKMAPFGLMDLDLYRAVLIRRDRICTSAEGARWTCGQRAYMTLRALLAQRPITCSFKPISVPPKAVCSVDDQDIAQFLLREGWAELPIDVTDQAYVEASELAHSRGLGIWGDAPP